MKIAFITDAWKEQMISGVVIWLVNMKRELESLGHSVKIIHPGNFLITVPLFTDPEIQLSFFGGRKMERMLKAMKPDQIHIVTEGPLGYTALQVCRNNEWKFTSFYHSRLPEYIQMRVHFLQGTTYKYLKWFHSHSECVMVPTPSLMTELKGKGFKKMEVVGHGINSTLFKRNPKAKLPKGLTKPVFTFFGRLAPEKNIEHFLKLDLPGSKLVIGDGQSRAQLEAEFGHQAHFVGRKMGQKLVDLLSISDVYVFPSETDTFGLTIVEALACGVPVAAYNVTGPKDILTNGKDGYLGKNLKASALKCLKLDPKDCLQKAKQYSWKKTTQIFLKHSVNCTAVSSSKTGGKRQKSPPRTKAARS